MFSGRVLSPATLADLPWPHQVKAGHISTPAKWFMETPLIDGSAYTLFLLEAWVSGGNLPVEG